MKFGKLDGLGTSVPYAYPHVWETQVTTSGRRLAIAPRSGYVTLLLDLVRELPEPHGLLYVLLVSRCGHDDARYQSPAPASMDETTDFIRTYGPYLEGDGRHHLWLQSLAAPATLVYDQHNIVYAYGDLDRYQAVLGRHGMVEGTVEVPVPHHHAFNSEFDAMEDRIMAHWEWRSFPLQAVDGA